MQGIVVTCICCYFTIVELVIKFVDIILNSFKSHFTQVEDLEDNPIFCILVSKKLGR